MAAGDPGSSDNYLIPTGKVWFWNDDALTAGYVWLGNCKNFGVANETTLKEHIRNWGGQRTIDYSVITTAGTNLDFAIDEITRPTLTMFALGTASDEMNTDGSYTITGLTNTRLAGLLKIEGDNDNGPQLTYRARVNLQPSGTMQLLQDNDDFASIPVKATVVNDDDLGMGKWTIKYAGT